MCAGRLCGRSWEAGGWNRCRSSGEHWSCSRDHRDPAARKPSERQAALEQLLIIASNTLLVGTAGTSVMRGVLPYASTCSLQQLQLRAVGNSQLKGQRNCISYSLLFSSLWHILSLGFLLLRTHAAFRNNARFSITGYARSILSLKT